MTDLRTAAQQALEAMLNFPDDISDEMFESITALKAALAEPVQKSKYIQHGWLCPSCGAGNSPMNMRCGCKGWPKMEITC